MEYPLMETPFILVAFQEMDKKQTEQYFQWYMTQINSRIRQLEEYAQKENQEVILDKTPESLITLWEWFEPHIEYEDMMEEDINKRILGQPEWIKEILIQNTKKNTIHTLVLAEDIAIYFSETMIHTHKEIFWGYKMKPKALLGVNTPILLKGKHVFVNPRQLVSVCINKSIKQRNRCQLYEIYKIWEGEI